MNSLKENAFFSKCAVQKQIHHLACWSPIPPPPPLEPCAEMANRRQPSDWLRGRELPPGTAPGSDLHSHMYWWRWVFLPFFWCRLSSAGICALRAVSTGVPTKQRQAHIRDPSANTHPWSSRSTGAPLYWQVFLKRRCVPMKVHLLL